MKFQTLLFSGLAAVATLPLLVPAAHAAATVPVRFERRVDTEYGKSVYVLGDHELLGNNDVTKALKLSPTNYPNWFVNVELPPATTINYRFLLRTDTPALAGMEANVTYLDQSPLTLTTDGDPLPRRTGWLNYYSGAEKPVLEIQESGGFRQVPFTRVGIGRNSSEALWRAVIDDLPPQGQKWQFRVDIGGGFYDVPDYGNFYTTTISRGWLQDRALFNYPPPPVVSAPRVEKIDAFRGRLAERSIHIYLPRGYDENAGKKYPVLYIHDGENSFEAHVATSPSQKTWKADEAATLLIRKGLVRECIMIAVASAPGGTERIPEYLPPYSKVGNVDGRADSTVAYYLEEVVPAMMNKYRILPGRENTGLVGASMGAVFNTYFAWESASFARHIGIMSPAYWITQLPNSGGDKEVIKRLREDERRDLRIYMDNGTISNFPQPGEYEDGMPETAEARDALIANGYAIGPDFVHRVYPRAKHDSQDWAARFPTVLEFLLPISQEVEPLEIPSPVRDVGMLID